jgi:hypothetical protein
VKRKETIPTNDGMKRSHSLTLRNEKNITDNKKDRKPKHNTKTNKHLKKSMIIYALVDLYLPVKKMSNNSYQMMICK